MAVGIDDEMSGRHLSLGDWKYNGLIGKWIGVVVMADVEPGEREVFIGPGDTESWELTVDLQRGESLWIELDPEHYRRWITRTVVPAGWRHGILRK